MDKEPKKKSATAQNTLPDFPASQEIGFLDDLAASHDQLTLEENAFSMNVGTVGNDFDLLDLDANIQNPTVQKQCCGCESKTEHFKLFYYFLY